MPERLDPELEQFRQVMEVPSQFEEGFRWSSLLGALFIAALMVPGAIYMGLLAGTTHIGAASRWATVILFIEVARRAQRHLRRAEIFVLFFMAGSAVALPYQGLLWNQFFARSDAAAAYGIAEQIPDWVAPRAGSDSYGRRTFLHADWLPVVAFFAFSMFLTRFLNVVIGYGLFRVASDFEKLPFPLAPVGAQGIMALAEDADETADRGHEKSWRWRVFAMGGALGLVFGAVYYLVPTLSYAVTGTSIQIFPIPFSDFSGKTGEYLPAVATGISWDFGNLVFGMVMPFFGMVGSFAGLVVTFVANPILYHLDILHNWKSGDTTIDTLFKNHVDFYFSFSIGVALAIAAVGIYHAVRALRRHRRAARAAGRSASLLDAAEPPRNRGDFKLWIAVVCFVGMTVLYVGVSALLLRWHHGAWTPDIGRVIGVLFLLGFVYTPLVAYASARLEGMVGQVVEIPLVHEASIILSGYHGVAVWFLPVPRAQFGQMAVFYRQCELTGTKFTGIWKTHLILYPIILISTVLFASFIWGLDEVPSAAYPFAEEMWELNARNQCIMFSSTLGEYSVFEEAFNWAYLAVGAGFGVVLFGALTTFGLPVTFVYGVVRGLGQTMPHAVIPQFIGALIGRYYFQHRLGLRWRQYIPVVAAGFACGVGLISLFGMGIVFLSKAIIRLPY
jgi:hypothetical protein